MNEMQIGRIATGGPTHLASNPAAKQNARIAYEIVVAVGNADTAKEKFEILNNLKAGQTTNKIVLVDPNGKKYSVVSYDQSTGAIQLLSWTGSRPVSTKVDNLKFKGKERSISSTKKNWIFSFDEMEQGEPTIKTPSDSSVKRGRPRNPTPSASAPLRLW